MIVGVIRRKPVFTHASIVCEGMLASVNSVNWSIELSRNASNKMLKRLQLHQGEIYTKV